MEHNTRTPDVLGLVDQYGLQGVLMELHDHVEFVADAWKYDEDGKERLIGLRAILESAAMYVGEHNLDIGAGGCNPIEAKSDV